MSFIRIQMNENLDDDCLSLLLQMLINLSRLQRVCVTTTKGKARRKKVSARSINYCFIYLYSELKWRSFTGTGWWRDARGRANFCVGRFKCDKSPKSILWRWHDRSTLLLTSQSVFLSSPPLVHSWLVIVVFFAAICVQHFPAGCMYCRHGIYVGGTHCNRCAWSSSAFISSPHCHRILGCCCCCCHLKEGWFWSSWKAILGPESLGHEIDGMHAIRGTGGGYRCCTNSSILMTRFWTWIAMSNAVWGRGKGCRCHTNSSFLMPTGQDFPVCGLLSSYWILTNLESSNSFFCVKLIEGECGSGRFAYCSCPRQEE